MDVKQLETRVAWLDEQRRKHDEAANRVGGQLIALQETLAKQGRQLQDLTSEVTRLESLASRSKQFEEALHKHRQEILKQLEWAEERRTEKEHQLESLRKGDQEEVAKSLDALRVEAAKIQALMDTLEARREEEIRITRTLDAMDKRLGDFRAEGEERRREVVALQEGRKLDARRLADIQAEMTDLRARTDSLRGATDVIEDRVRHAETGLAELAASDNERREGQFVWQEQQTMKQVEMERSWKEWVRKLESHSQKADQFEERVLAYDETHRHLRQLRTDLDAILARLERRITEITEMQRLADERMRHEWASFQADDQKRWNAYKLVWDEQWREHMRAHDSIADSLQGHGEGLSQLAQAMHSADEAGREHIAALLRLFNSWAGELRRGAGEVR